MTLSDMPQEDFIRTTEDFGPLTRKVARAEMVLFAYVPLDPEGITLDIMVETEPQDAVALDEPDEPPFEVEHNLTTQWMTIPRTALRSKDAAALDGFALNWEATADAVEQPPAGVGREEFGMVDRFALSLTHLGDNRYHLKAEGVSEFDSGFVVDCTVRLDRVELRPETALAATEADAEAALADLFPMPGSWKDRGSPEHSWRDLIASFAKET